MKKILLSILFLFSLSYLKADGLSTIEDTITSSYTESSNAGAVLFSSYPIQIVGMTVSSPATGGYLAIFRSTASIFTIDITTQWAASNDFMSNASFPASYSIPVYDLKNTSYTYINKVGNAKVVLTYRCLESKSGQGVCPGPGRSSQGK